MQPKYKLLGIINPSLLQRAVVGISDSTKSDLDSLLHEVKKEQGGTEMPMSSGGDASGIFSHVSHTLPTSHKRLSRDPTLDVALQHELKETHEKSLASYRKLQVSVNMTVIQ